MPSFSALLSTKKTTIDIPFLSTASYDCHAVYSIWLWTDLALDGNRESCNVHLCFYNGILCHYYPFLSGLCRSPRLLLFKLLDLRGGTKLSQSFRSFSSSPDSDDDCNTNKEESTLPSTVLIAPIPHHQQYLSSKPPLCLLEQCSFVQLTDYSRFFGE
ncbi:hypothetical protein GYMLUDRAFT_644614 [Collybiopsis luxurians FD-317 M1]|nr:hypothetical protein GYMLUDRAFT_644614 [Collybiopsis luxurians FD-317 M1]